MNPYWLKIAGGSLAIFGVGMGAISLGRKGLRELRTATTGSIQSMLRNPLPALAFRLDGTNIGTIKSVDVQNGGATPADVRIEVDLKDQSATANLKSCNLASDRNDRQGRGFYCADADEVQDLEAFGEVVFQNAGITRPLYLTPRQLREWRRSDIKELAASLETDSVTKKVKGQAHYDIVKSGGDHERGTVDLRAGDGGAFLQVRDENGNEIVKLSAGEGGLQFNVHDKKGREIMRLLGGQGGLDLRVKGDRSTAQ